jgi:hypothetical protein
VNRAVISCWKKEEVLLEMNMGFNLAIRIPLRWIAVLLYLFFR